ncbi:MAG: carbonic anhydrase family protein [Burkholderiaceae bacterium]|nr:carbonic anhydrase family protein [Burkholderiaceae bacterium]
MRVPPVPRLAAPCLLAALAAGLVLPTDLYASEAAAGSGHAQGTHRARPAAAPAAAAAAGDEAVRLEQLRERLEARLSETGSRGAAPGVLRVTAPAVPPKAHPAPRRTPARSKPAAPADAHAASAPAAHAAAHAPHWSYAGEGAPGQWAALKPEFATCGLGQRQSPIDIRGGIRVDLEPIRFDYRPSSFSVIDNGHTVQANVSGANSLEVGGRRYDLLQFHFHRPSEERIEGRQYEMSMHLVHRDPEGRLAVVAVLLEQGPAHPAVQLVWNSLPLERHQEQAAPLPLDLNLLLPQDRRYFTYMGSLTTPPCSEGVLWMVLKQPVALSPQQLAVFARLYPMNARPVQPLAGRLIKESN